jgi:hypothetical protein
MEIAKNSTTLTEIRGFLQNTNCAPTAWCSSSQVLAAFYDALTEHEDDPKFWADLRVLYCGLNAKTVRPLFSPGYEVLASSAVDDILEELRGSLGLLSSGKKLSFEQWIGSKLSGGVLTAFLMLAATTTTTVGCDNAENSDSGGTYTPANCDVVAEQYSLSTAGTDALCDIADLVENADLSDEMKQDLIDCLASHGTETIQSYLENFQSLSSDELSFEIEDMFDSCGMCSDDGDCH